MSQVAHQPPRTLREVRTCLVKKSSFASLRDDRHALVVRGERGAHVDAEDGELHAEEGERHAERQEPEERAEVDREAQRDERELDPAALDLAAAEQVLDAERVQVQALERQQREEQPPLAAGDRGAQEPGGLRGILLEERDGVDLDVGVLADAVRVRVVARVLAHPPASS